MARPRSARRDTHRECEPAPAGSLLSVGFPMCGSISISHLRVGPRRRSGVLDGRRFGPPRVEQLFGYAGQALAPGRGAQPVRWNGARSVDRPSRLARDRRRRFRILSQVRRQQHSRPKVRRARQCSYRSLKRAHHVARPPDRVPMVAPPPAFDAISGRAGQDVRKIRPGDGVGQPAVATTG